MEQETKVFEKPTEKRNLPLQLLTGALKKVRGDNTLQLVEDFTSEMTMVAEGLCDDQSRVRSELADVRRDSDRIRQNLKGEIDTLSTDLESLETSTSEKLKDMSLRLTAIENCLKEKQKKRGFFRGDQGSFMQQLTLIVSIAAGSWVLVTLLNLFR